MIQRIAFLYTRENRYSVHALVSALDRSGWNGEILLLNPEEFLRFACTNADAVAAVSFNTIWFARNLSFFERLRECKALLIAGGPHPTGDPVGTLNLGFDYVFVGDAEETLPEFLEGGDPKGVVYKDGDEYVYTGRPDPVDLGVFPSFPWWRGIFGPVEIERGCNHSCRYCETWFIHGRSRYRSLESIEEHVQAMVRAGRRDLRFIASDFFSYPNVERLLRLKEEYPIRVFAGSFPSEVRPESVNDYFVEMLRAYVSNKHVTVGAQSGSDRMLELMNRGHTVEDVRASVDVLTSFEFIPDVDFIFGLPGETEEDVDETIRLMEWIVKKGGRIHTHAFMPLPGTPWEDKPAGHVPERVRSWVKRMTGKGKAFGYWAAQERTAQRIRFLYRKGVILGLRGWALLRPHLHTPRRVSDPAG